MPQVNALVSFGRRGRGRTIERGRGYGKSTGR